MLPTGIYLTPSIPMISICKRSFLAYTVFPALLLLMVCCRSETGEGKKYALASLEKVLGKELIVGEDSILSCRKPKILILLSDTGTCTACSMQVYDWYLYRLALDNKKIECDIIYLLSDSVRLEPHVQQMLGYYKLHVVKGLEPFIRQNHLSGQRFDTFLVDSVNTIKLAGNPLHNVKLWDLYKKVLVGEAH